MAEPGSAGAALGLQLPSADGADMAGVEQLAGGESEGGIGEVGVAAVGAHDGAHRRMGVAGKAAVDAEGEPRLKAERGAAPDLEALGEWRLLTET